MCCSRDNSLCTFLYPIIQAMWTKSTSTWSCPWTGLGRRSASISYFKILKHSSLSSKNCAYVRTQAEQSQAGKEQYRTRNFIVMIKQIMCWPLKKQADRKDKEIKQTYGTRVILEVRKLKNPSPWWEVQKFFSEGWISLPQKSVNDYQRLQCYLSGQGI